uniref:condensation domain-containing protein n=1 Tax=Burkholderia alba TaxID=2683677 RepID=UPI002B05BCAE
KLRGQRIELGEIEAVLRQCAGVREAAVIVLGEGEKQRLAGYVAGEVEAVQVRHELEQRLPGYMVPSSLTVLEKLPAMPNGKLDRAALPAPQERARERVEASNETEAALLSIWKAVLGRDDLGVTDNFFEAGGDSIQSLQIIARAREAGLKLTPRQVFEHPTVAGLAQRAERLEARTEVEEDNGDPQSLTPIQQAFFERYPEGESHWNQAVLLKVKGRLNEAALEQAVQALRTRHDALRLRFAADESGWKQHAIAASEAEGDLIRREDLVSMEDLEAACDGIQSSLDIERGPIWRVGYFEAREETRLLITIHHLSVDGVSWRVLLEELQTSYEQAERGEPVMLPTPSMPWRSWVRAAQHYAQSPDRLAELAWWQTALDAPSLRGPLFPPRSPVSAPQKTLQTKLSPALTAALLREAPRAYRMRVDEVLLAALGLVVGDAAGRDEVLVELEGHGREDVIDGADLSRTVGWFTTQYPLALPGAGAPADALRQVRERVANVPQKGFNRGLLMHGADPASRAALAALPDPQISFNYLGRFDQTFQAESRLGFASEKPGNAIAPSARAPDRLLDINGWITGDTLSFSWGYAPQYLSDTQAAQFAAAFERTLAALIEYLAAAPAAPDAAAAARPPVPAAFDAIARQDGDGVAASWTARARFEAGLPVPPADALRAWVARRFPSVATEAAPDDAMLPAVPLNALDAPATLFCLHPGYGMIGEYRTLAHALNGRVTLIALQAPAVRGRPWRGDTFEALAAYYAGCIETLQPAGAYALLGWSFGGRLAIAIAAHLAQRGKHVSFTGILDTATHWEAGPESAAPDHDDAPPERALLDAAGPSLLRDAFAADTLHADLMARHALPTIATDLHVWRALRNTAAPSRRMAWAPQTSARLHEHPVDATHTSIVHHPALGEQLASLLAPGAAKEN